MIGKVFAAGVDIGSQFALGDRGIDQVFPTPGSLLSVILFNVYGLVGLIVLVMLIFGGYSIIMGAGSKDGGQIQKGQKALVGAIAGFLIIFVSYFIVQVVEIVTGINILNPNV
ncbi:MAG: hypothetical protein ABID04_01255 [Patescibacteria group bacterium]